MGGASKEWAVVWLEEEAWAVEWVAQVKVCVAVWEVAWAARIKECVAAWAVKKINFFHHNSKLGAYFSHLQTLLAKRHQMRMGEGYCVGWNG